MTVRTKGQGQSPGLRERTELEAASAVGPVGERQQGTGMWILEGMWAVSLQQRTGETKTRTRQETSLEDSRLGGGGLAQDAQLGSCGE